MYKRVISKGLRQVASHSLISESNADGKKKSEEIKHREEEQLKWIQHFSSTELEILF